MRLQPGALSPAPSIALERSTLNGGVHLSGNQGVIAVATNTISRALLCRNNAFALEDEGFGNIITGAMTCNFVD